MNMEEKIALKEWALRIVYYMNSLADMEILNNDASMIFIPNVHIYTGIEQLSEVLGCELVENESGFRMTYQDVEFFQLKGEKVDRCQNS